MIRKHEIQSSQGFQVVLRSQLKWNCYINDKVYAEWDSLASSIDSKKNKLTYTYSCTNYSKKVSFEGIGVFNLEKKSPNLPPKIIDGYSTDVTDGKRTQNREYHIDDEFIDSKKALEKAIELFGTNPTNIA